MTTQPNQQPCSNRSHYLSILNTDAERCTCGRKLWRRPPQKCSRHGVWFCAEPGCFTDNDLQALRGFDEFNHEDDDDENEKD
jgi:hypothetical protein